MIRFRWHRIVFQADFSFFAVAALVGLLGGEGLFLQLFLVCLLHECGHLLALRLFHRKIQQIRFCGAGITICPGSFYGAYWQDILISLAGPLVNLLFAGILLPSCQAFGAMHLGLGLFNLLPFRCLDGGSVLDGILYATGVASQRIFFWENSICLLVGVGIMLFCYKNGICSVSLSAMLMYLTIMQFFGS